MRTEEDVLDDALLTIRLFFILYPFDSPWLAVCSRLPCCTIGDMGLLTNRCVPRHAQH
jgi:hypothetical protein